MNIYKSLLFLHGHLLESALTADDFGPTYGNRVASEKALRERWESERDQVEIRSITARTEVIGLTGCG